MGVFEMPYGIQLSPVFQAASARPYNLTAGSDLNGDGANTDRWIDPATGQQVHINAGRGDNTVVMDLRTTKFVELGGERRIGFFAEVFNLFNTANFGERYQGNGRSTDVPAAEQLRGWRRLSAPGADRRAVPVLERSQLESGRWSRPQSGSAGSCHKSQVPSSHIGRAFQSRPFVHVVTCAL